MKSLVFLVAASMMLVGATTAVAIPNVVEAVNTLWCGDGGCFTGKGKCERASSDGVCVKGKPWEFP